MIVDKEFLTKSLEGLRMQRDQQLVTLGKVEGAIDIVNALLARLDQPDPVAPLTTKLDA